MNLEDLDFSPNLQLCYLSLAFFESHLTLPVTGFACLKEDSKIAVDVPEDALMV